MPLETRKVLWTVVSISIVLVVASGIAVALFLPSADSSAAPAAIAGAAPPRTISPEAYVRETEPAPVPAASQPAPTGDSVIIVYGDKPSPQSLPGSDGRPAIGTGAAATTSTPKAVTPGYKPAPPAGTAKPAPATAKPTVQKTTTATEYWIQAGSFSSRSRSEDLQRDLGAKGLASVITLKDVDGQTLYRVRIGPYSSKTSAENWLGRVRSLPGCAEAYVSMQTVQRTN
ncbi:MAG: SPOR domain-containing protein [Spirochaetales bacterium]|nr:MAG: SPOR domain-containing protein [Spirochaetales bacterium]